MIRTVYSLAFPFLMLVGIAGVAAFAADGAAPTKEYNLGAGNLALGGYDPVSYFGTASPSKGSKDVTAEVGGVVYRFSSETDRSKFLADPPKYQPAYGGWCATAMAKGKKVDVDPRNYRVTNGRLFLFYKTIVYNAQDDWKKDEAGMGAKADAAWKRIAGD